VNDFLNFNPDLPERVSFVGTLQIAWDSTSIGYLKECPYKYYLAIVAGIVPMGEAVHLKFGLLYHGALEEYEKARARGETRDDAVTSAVHYCLVNSWEPRLNRGWVSGHETKNRFTLVRTVVDYLDTFNDQTDSLRTILLPNGKPATELSFNFKTNYVTPFGYPYKLCGHLDKVVKERDDFENTEADLHILDHKTTSLPLNTGYWNQYNPNNQVSLYYYSGQIIFKTRVRNFIIDAVRITANADEFERRSIPRTESQLEEWYKDLGCWIAMAEAYSQQNYWPKNEKSCVKGFITCEYIGICQNCPSTRKLWSGSGFGKRSWDPLKVRGEE
jgi:hypothetical protein